MPALTRSYFPYYRTYRRGTDADHVPVIPGNDFPPDASYQDESPLFLPAPGDADMGQTPFGQLSSLEIGAALRGRVKPHNYQPNRSVACTQ
jgi:hypothetical protein